MKQSQPLTAAGKSSRTFRRIAWIIFLLAVVTMLSFFWRSQASSPSPARNVLLITIDTCRADYLSCYGYPLKTTPNIDKIAAQGIRFENVLSPIPLTLPAHSSIMTGTIPPRHKVHDNLKYELGTNSVTLAETLKEHGYKTVAITSAFVLDSKFGLAQGFDDYEDQFDEAVNDGERVNERIAEEVNRHAMDWLDNNGTDRFFMFLHYYDPHFTYAPPEPFASRFKKVPYDQQDALHFPPGFLAKATAGYAGEIAYVDHCIGLIVEKLKQLGLFESTLIVITADHGEMLGAHGELGHGYFIYQEAIKVPLIIKAPSLTKPEIIRSNAGLIDIFPTICSLQNIAVPAQVQGTALLDHRDRNTMEKETRTLYCESLLPTKYTANPLLGIVSGKYKYIQTTRPELYDLSLDPKELDDLSVTEHHRARILQSDLAEIIEQSVVAKETRTVSMDAETIKRLQSLGYVRGEVSEDFSFDTTKPDPKGLIGYHDRTMGMIHLKDQGKYEDAKVICHELIAENPGVHQIYGILADLEMELKNYRQAMASLEKATELDPKDVQAYRNMAHISKIWGEEGLATTYYRKALEIEPKNFDTLYAIAVLYHKQNKLEQAVDFIEQALVEQPDHLKARGLLVACLSQQNRSRDVVEQCEYILRNNPDYIYALNYLAEIKATSDDASLKDPDGAVKLATKACNLTQHKTPELLDTLAMAYAAAGRYPEALASANKALQLAKEQDKTELAATIDAHINLYKTKSPSSEPR